MITLAMLQGGGTAEKAREQPGCSLDEAEAAAAAHEAPGGRVVARDEGQGMTEGPGPRDVFEPGQHGPRDFRRGPLTEGRAAVSPGHEAPDLRVPVMPPGTAEAVRVPGIDHVDLTGSRTMARPLSPWAAPGPRGES